MNTSGDIERRETLFVKPFNISGFVKTSEATVARKNICNGLTATAENE
jgi:hypothetical protein